MVAPFLIYFISASAGALTFKTMLAPRASAGVATILAPISVNLLSAKLDWAPAPVSTTTLNPDFINLF